MAISASPIVRPKKGPANTGKYVKRGTATGRLIKETTIPRPRKPGQTGFVESITGVRSGKRADMVAKIRQGLAFNSIERLEKAFGASRKEMASTLSIPISTMTRRKQDGKLHPDESDRVVRLAQLMDQAVAMMQGDEQAALTWLRTPLDIFKGETPLRHADTELGARDVEDLILRIRHGVFS